MASRSIGVDLNRPYVSAIEYSRARKIVLPDVYYGQLQGQERARAWSVAGIAELDQLEAVFASLNEALEKGESFGAWKRKVKAGQIPLDLPRHRIETIFRTNIQAAYGQGRDRRLDENKAARGFFMYDAINDSRTRETHSAMDGYIAKHDDPIWQHWRPPAGYNCRCSLLALTESQAIARGFGRQPKPEVAPDEGWDYDRLLEPMRGLREARAAKARTQPRPVRAKAEKAAKVADANDPATWRELPGTQRGSNPGGLFEAPDGTRFYVKFPADFNQAKSEVAAARIYEALGIETVRPFLVKIGQRNGIASKFRDDLKRVSAADVAKNAEEAARIFQASVLTKNWDFVGASVDNLMLTPAGRLAIVDTGASFKYRAQGGAKPYGADIEEVRSFVTQGRNEAAPIFRPLFEADPWLEQRGARAVLDLDRQKVADEFTRLGFSEAETKELTAALWARREALIDRYDLDNRRMPARFEPLVEEFKRRGGTAMMPAADAASRVADVRAAHMKRSEFVSAKIPLLESMLKEKAYPKAPASAKRVFNKGWSGSSSSDEGGLMKAWAVDRFGSQGVEAKYHSGLSRAKERVQDAVQTIEMITGLNRDKLYSMLDVEYAFHQYHLRQIHGWDTIKTWRGMNQSEFDADYKDGIFAGNAVSSHTASEGAWTSTTRRVEAETPVERVLKTWLQGHGYMHYGLAEAEYVVIGAPIKARKFR